MTLTNEIEEIKNGISQWIEDNTQIIAISSDTLEVATTQIDSFGDTIYCFVKRNADNTYNISDEGRILFKLDPSAKEKELYQTAKAIAIGAGFNFMDNSSEISVTTDKDNIAMAIIKLSQLQVAISYL